MPSKQETINHAIMTLGIISLKEEELLKKLENTDYGMEENGRDLTWYNVLEIHQDIIDVIGSFRSVLTVLGE